MTILSFSLFQVEQLSVTGHLVLVNSLQVGSLHRNSEDRITDRPDMTLIVLTGP